MIWNHSRSIVCSEDKNGKSKCHRREEVESLQVINNEVLSS